MERTYLVTGCASGIGRRVAGELLGRGARVAATDLDIRRLREIAQADGWPEDRTLVRRLDVRDADEWEQALDAAEDRLGVVSVLLNIAGFLRPGWVREVEVDDVDRHFDVNTKGVVFGTRAAARRMADRGEGHIVNMASLAALAPVPGLSLYSASKFAVRAFSIAAAHELRESGVAVTVLCPDAVQTPMLDLQRGRPEAELTFSGQVLTVDDVCAAILDDILVRRPLEVVLPRSRGVLARTADLFPESARRVEPLLRWVGRRRQRR